MLSMFLQYGVPLLMMGMVPLAAWLMKIALAQGSKAGLQNQLLAKVEHFASVAVAAVGSSPLKDSILAATSTGTITAAGGAQLKAAAIATMKQLLGTEGLDDIRSLLGVADPEVLLGASVEKAVDVSNSIAAVGKVAAVAPKIVGP